MKTKEQVQNEITRLQKEADVYYIDSQRKDISDRLKREIWLEWFRRSIQISTLNYCLDGGDNQIANLVTINSALGIVKAMQKSEDKIE